MYFVYSVVLAAALALSAPYWLVQMLRAGKYRAGLGERFGRVPARVMADKRPCIWIHAVSVGEVLGVSGLIAQLRERFPAYRVVVSTTTATGQKLARERFGAENVFYFPLDFAFAIRRYMCTLRPELVVLAETEFWPNFLRLAHAVAPIAVVNARISDRSLPRYRRLRGLLARVLNHVGLFLAQSEEDRRRLIEIGVPPERVEVSGNLKFDSPRVTASPLMEAMQTSLGNAGPVIVCGSTVEGEEVLLLAAFHAVLQRWPDAVVVLAPRHPERFEEVARLLAASGLRFWRRSRWNGEPVAGGIFLLDSIGELAATYALGQVAFVGGSLVPRGGHNVLEAAQACAAVLVGPHTENFRDIVRAFQHAGALRVVTADETAKAIIDLLSDEPARERMTRRACEVLSANAGATEHTLRTLTALLTKEAHEVGR